MAQNSQILEKKLLEFGVEGRVTAVNPGPVITSYEIEPGAGIKIHRIVALADDLALGLKALSVRVVAPIPGKAAVGVEIPNQHRATVHLREILGTKEFGGEALQLPLALGKEIGGTPMVADLTQMPHLLIAGETGSGKSVCINSLILSLAYRAEPRDVRLLLIDPKRVELSVYNGVPTWRTRSCRTPRRPPSVSSGSSCIWRSGTSSWPRRGPGTCRATTAGWSWSRPPKTIRPGDRIAAASPCWW